eukprot:2438099-Rhodomonas_salina.1
MSVEVWLVSLVCCVPRSAFGWRSSKPNTRARNQTPELEIKQESSKSDTSDRNQTPELEIRHESSKSDTRARNQTRELEIKHESSKSDTRARNQTREPAFWSSLYRSKSNTRNRIPVRSACSACQLDAIWLTSGPDVPHCTTLYQCADELYHVAHVHVREVTCDDSSSTNTGSPASASAGPSQARAEAVRASVQVDPNVALARSAGVPGPRTAGINLESPDVEV